MAARGDEMRRRETEISTRELARRPVIGKENTLDGRRSDMDTLDTGCSLPVGGGEREAVQTASGRWFDGKPSTAGVQVDANVARPYASPYHDARAGLVEIRRIERYR